VSGGLLPEAADPASYRDARSSSDFVPAAAEICRRHGIPQSGLARADSGTHLVFMLDGMAIKVFAPLWPEDFEAERAALHAMGGGPFPAIAHEGTLEGWPYLVITRIPGRPARDPWPLLSRSGKESLLHELGGLLRRLHRIPAPPDLQTDWPAFASGLEATLESRNDPPSAGWRDWMVDRAHLDEDPFEPVLLHADVTWDHVFALRDGEGIRLSGLIDFGDAMSGHPLYEFGAPLLYMCFGEPDLTWSLLSGYGLPRSPGTARSVLAYSLLHRFGRLGRWLEKVPVADGRAFEEALFGSDPGCTGS